MDTRLRRFHTLHWVRTLFEQLPVARAVLRRESPERMCRDVSPGPGCSRRQGPSENRSGPYRGDFNLTLHDSAVAFVGRYSDIPKLAEVASASRALRIARFTDISAAESWLRGLPGGDPPEVQCGVQPRWSPSLPCRELLWPRSAVVPCRLPQAETRRTCAQRYRGEPP